MQILQIMYNKCVKKNKCWEGTNVKLYGTLRVFKFYVLYLMTLSVLRLRNVDDSMINDFDR
jgi:hypothetical protein